MILSLQAQAQLFLLTLLLGGGLGLAYDGLRVFRRILPHKRIWVQAEDGVFWLAAVFLVFGVMLRASGGEIRFFSLCGLFGGMGLYFLACSRFVLGVSDCVLDWTGRIVRLFLRIVCTPFWLLWLPLRRPVRKIGGFCGKVRKKLLQSGKLCVKIRIQHWRRDWKLCIRRKKRGVQHGKKKTE